MLVTGAQSSRVKKRRSNANNNPKRSSSSSPFSSNARRKPLSRPRTQSKLSEDDEHEDSIFDEPLDDTGVMASLATDLNMKDTAQFMENIHRRMFDDIPEGASGMNSVRIAEILNYRKSLPPLVTIAHTHSLSRSITRADREIAELVQAAIVRKLTIPHRGSGTSNVGDGLVLVSQWKKYLAMDTDLSESTKTKYVSLLRDQSIAPVSYFTPNELQLLTSCGFITSSTQLRGSKLDTFFRPGASTFSNPNSFVGSGASGSGIVQGHSMSSSQPAPCNLTLPNVGLLLKLIVDARAHLLSLLSKTSKHKEAPLSVLRERWDGGVITNSSSSQSKKSRGESAGVLPGKTKKWRNFQGLRFEWILEECVGAGLVECFNTGSVGIAARLVQ